MKTTSPDYIQSLGLEIIPLIQMPSKKWFKYGCLERQEGLYFGNREWVIFYLSHHIEEKFYIEMELLHSFKYCRFCGNNNIIENYNQAIVRIIGKYFQTAIKRISIPTKKENSYLEDAFNEYRIKKNNNYKEMCDLMPNKGSI